MKVTGIRLIDSFGMSLIKVYNHSLYWKMRAIVVNPRSKCPQVIKCIFLVLLKIMDEYHCAFIGTGIGYGAHFDSPLQLPHGLNGIVIHERTHIGKHCTILHQVTFGGTVRNGVPVAPTCGDNCLFGAGAKILGGITIGNNVKVGANAVVTTDMPDNVTCVGIPAKIVKRGN